MKSMHKRFTVKNSDRIELLAKIYFQHQVLNMPRMDISEEMNIPITTIGTYFSKHINQLVKNPTDERYSMFYEGVKKIAEASNRAIDLVPPEITNDIKIEVDESGVKIDTSLLIERNKLTRQSIEISQVIEKHSDHLLNSMFISLQSIEQKLNEIIDNLTVKQFRTKNYPEHFKCQFKVIQVRAADIVEMLNSFQDNDFQTDTSRMRKSEVEDLLSIIYETINKTSEGCI